MGEFAKQMMLPRGGDPRFAEFQNEAAHTLKAKEELRKVSGFSEH